MSANEHLNQQQFTMAHVRRAVGGYPVEDMGPNDPKAKFRLDPAYPLARVNVVASDGASHDRASNIDDGYYGGLEKKVLKGRSKPIVVSDAAKAPEATLHDGWHRASIAKAHGLTHLPAYVRDLDNQR